MAFSDLLNVDSYETILASMLARVPGDMDKREGSIIYDALAPAAFELYRRTSILAGILDQAFASTATEEWLDLIATDYGMERLQANPAKVTLHFTGTNGAVIPAGTLCGIVGSSLAFSTDAQGVIANGFCDVAATCKTAGEVGNVAAHKITLILAPIPDVRTVDNPEAAKGGTDRESDDSLRARILNQKQNPEHGGTTSDYVRWALAITGVNYARAIDKARGIGTVDLIIGTDSESIIDDLVVEVQADLDDRKPMGVDLKVRKTQFQTVQITVNVQGITQQTASAAILAYTKTIGVGGTLSISRLYATLINASATDATVLTPTANVELGADSMIDPQVVFV